MADGTNNDDLARRKLLKLAVYVAPAVVTTVALKAHAQPTPSCNPNLCPPWIRCDPDRCNPRPLGSPQRRVPEGLSVLLQPADYFLPPAWIAVDDGDALRVQNAATGVELSVAGDLRAWLLSGDPAAAGELRALATVEPALGALADSLAEGAFAPLTRAALLKGTGYRLLFLELTAACNERCQHCYAGSGPHRTEALPPETLDAVLGDARALGFTAIQLTGGDPLVSPHCAWAAERALTLGFETVELYTNGLALTGALADRLLALPLAWAFSVYSHDASTHDAITRVDGSHARTVEAISRALATRRPVRIGVVQLETNATHGEATVAMLERLGVSRDAVGFDVQRHVGRGRYAGDGAALPRTPGESHVVEGRRTFEGRAAVSADGTVYPCIFSRALPLGSVLQRRLRELLGDPTPLAPADRNAAAWGDRLSCWECRLRAALLQPGSPGATPGGRA